MSDDAQDTNENIPGDAPTDAEQLDYAHPGIPDDREGDFADELDGLRIRQLSSLRRGAIRSRSYALIGFVACLVGAIQLGLLTIRHVRAFGWGSRPMGFVLFAVAALLIGGYFARRAAELKKEIDTPAPLPPVPPGGPDFSTLSDGSQQWKNLEDMR